MSTLLTLPPARERLTLGIFAAIQFTHILDFMIMMPLGSQLMRVFDLTPAQFSHLVAAYGASAAIAGLLSSAFLDRVERKKTLIGLYLGFGLATVACALAPNFEALFAARCAAGIFGGVASSVLTAMIGDIIPPQRRGQAFGVVMTAFPIASVLGIPLSLWLTTFSSWHAPFVFLAGSSAIIALVASRALPAIPPHPVMHSPFRQMKEILWHPIHARALLVTATLVIAGNCIIPFFAPSFVANVGLTEAQLPLIYLAGGLATLITTPLVGRLSDRCDKWQVLAWLSAGAAAVVLYLTRMGPSPVWLCMAVTAAFMVCMSGRFGSATAMVSNAVEARYRGGFMSINSAVQQAAASVANLIAGVFVTRGADGHLYGFAKLGWISVGVMVLNLVLGRWLRRAAPHSASNAIPATAPAAPID